MALYLFTLNAHTLQVLVLLPLDLKFEEAWPLFFYFVHYSFLFRDVQGGWTIFYYSETKYLSVGLCMLFVLSFGLLNKQYDFVIMSYI